MNKNFFKRPFYYTAGKISRIMKNFQKKQDEKIIENNNNSWNVLFGNNNFFQFNLANDVKINLYKDSILSRLIYDGFEKDEINYMSSVLEKGDIFIDVGANIGLFSLIASKKVGNDGLVISFEPSPTTYKRFIENIELNSYENIDARNIGLSDKKEELMFFVSNTGYDAWNSFAPRKDNILKEKISVPLSTLDIELIRKYKKNKKELKVSFEYSITKYKFKINVYKIFSKVIIDDLDIVWLKKGEIAQIPIPTLFKKILN